MINCDFSGSNSSEDVTANPRTVYNRQGSGVSSMSWQSLGHHSRETAPKLTQPQNPSGHLQIAVTSGADGLAGAKLLGRGSIAQVLPCQHVGLWCWGCTGDPHAHGGFWHHPSRCRLLHSCCLLLSSFPSFGNSQGPHTCCQGDPHPRAASRRCPSPPRMGTQGKSLSKPSMVNPPGHTEKGLGGK